MASAAPSIKIFKILFDHDKNASLLGLNHKKYTFNNFDKMETDLNKIKGKLDDYWSNSNFKYYWNILDPFTKEFKKKIAIAGNITNVSNAFLKLTEILTLLDLFPELITNNTLVHFDNAAFPGSWIIAMYHWVLTNYKIQYKWYASSLIDADGKELMDTYKLYKNYPNNWLMSEDNNGDVTDIKNILNVNKILPGVVNLYTSDLGFDVSSDYTNQERSHYYAVIGEILMALLTLAKGGSFIMKQFTMLKAYSISLIYVLGEFFEEISVCKPVTSRAPNSEIYIIGKGFKGGAYNEHPYIKGLFDQLKEYKNSKEFPEPIPLFYYGDYPSAFLKQILNINKELTTSQITALEINFKIATDQAKHKSQHSKDQYAKDNNRTNQLSPFDKMQNTNKEIANNWWNAIKIQYLPNNLQLKMYDLLGQLP